MTEKAPERIWATPEDGYCTATDLPGDKRDALGFVEYIRADLAPQWRPISEAPRDGTQFLGFGSYVYPGDNSRTEYYVLAEYSATHAKRGWPWVTSEGAHQPDFLTHFMPLPEAPQ